MYTHHCHDRKLTQTVDGIQLPCVEPGFVGDYPDLSTYIHSQLLPSPFTGPFLQASWVAPGHSQISALATPPAPPPALQTMVVSTPPPQRYTTVSDPPGPSQQGVWPHTMETCGILHKKGYQLRSVLAVHRD